MTWQDWSWVRSQLCWNIGFQLWSIRGEYARMTMTKTIGAWWFGFLAMKKVIYGRFISSDYRYDAVSTNACT